MRRFNLFYFAKCKPEKKRNRRQAQGFIKGSVLLICIVLMLVILMLGWSLNARQLTYTAQNYREADRVRLSNASRNYQEGLVSASEIYLKKLVVALQEVWNDKVAAGQPPPTLAEAQAFLKDFFPRYVPFEMRGATIADGMSPELKYYLERISGTALMRIDLDGIVPRSSRGLPGNGIVVLLKVTIPYRLQLTEKALAPEGDEIRQFGSYWTLVTAESGPGSSGSGTGGGKDSPSRASKKPPKPDTLAASPYLALPNYETTVEYKVDVAFSPPVKPPVPITIPAGGGVPPCDWYPVPVGTDENGNQTYTLESSCGGTIMGTFTGPNAANNAETAAGQLGGSQSSSIPYQAYISDMLDKDLFEGPLPNSGGGLIRPPRNQWNSIDGDTSSGGITLITLTTELGIRDDSNVRSIRLRFSDPMPHLPGRFSY